MKVIHSVIEMREAVRLLRSAGGRVGFVPTMGSLHQGHVSLMRLSRRETMHTVVSIFINPTQFGPHEDFAAYPRDIERDMAFCDESGVAVLFVPSVEDIYAQHASVSVIETALSKTMCGKARPGHFDGVCTVVAKLFQIVQPDMAFFGQKDAQQVAVIRRMVRDLFFPIEIAVGPIVRESDGLALSSRNVYLSDTQRQEALGLSSTLFAMRAQWVAGISETCMLVAWGQSHLAQHYPGVEMEYLVCCDPVSLVPCEQATAGCLVAIAARVGNTRLIDNVIF